jgi:peroxiredoxin
MARTESQPIALGTPAPDFSLPDVITDNTVSRDDFADRRGLLVMFICNHCPFVKHIADALAALGRDYQDKDLGIVAISSNDVDNYPADAPERMKEEAAARGYVFPYLYDASQAVARAYDAACTPDFFLYDADHKLAYHGQFDASRPGNDAAITGADLRAACDAVLAGERPAAEQTPSIGCNIKWKAS